MIMKINNTENFNVAKEITSLVSTIIFIIFSLFLYLVQDNKFFLITLVLYTANLFMLIELLLIQKKYKDIILRKNIYWFIIQFFVNILGIILSYLVYKSVLYS